MRLPLIIAILQRKQELVPQPEDLKGVLIINNCLMRSLRVLLQSVMKRFSDAESFSFLDLVNPKFFNQWKNAVLQGKILQLREKYIPLFDIPKLQSPAAVCIKINIFLKKLLLSFCSIYFVLICRTVSKNL